MSDRQLRLQAKTNEELAQAVADNLQVINTVAPTIATMVGTYDEQMARRATLSTAIQALSEFTLEQYWRNNNATDR